jgi:hypothetical protein
MTIGLVMNCYDDYDATSPSSDCCTRDPRDRARDADTVAHKQNVGYYAV